MSAPTSPTPDSKDKNARPLPEKLCGKRILITGGTGTTGQHLIQWLQSETDAEEIIVYSRDEQKHHDLQLNNGIDLSRVRSFIGDVRDIDQLKVAMSGVSLVFHTAAMKHVHLAEEHPIEAHKTNVLGTRNVIEAAIDCKVNRVISSSTDKAVDPINVYGNTKFMMELELMGADRENKDVTRFDIVRHGNLIGSRGSVIPLFIQQAKAGCMTLTYPAMTRFWIGKEELIDSFHRCLMESEGGEIHVPRSPACRIDVLATAIDAEADQEVLGIRAGEKKHEVLTSLHESSRLRDCGTHLVIRREPAVKDERGTAVEDDFQLRSDLEPQLEIAQMQLLLQSEGLSG